MSEWQLTKAVGERLVAGMSFVAVRSIEGNDYKLQVVKAWVQYINKERDYKGWLCAYRKGRNQRCF